MKIKPKGGSKIPPLTSMPFIDTSLGNITQSPIRVADGSFLTQNPQSLTKPNQSADQTMDSQT